MGERHNVVVANSTPLISLARCGLFHLLRGLYGRITLLPAVYREVVIEGGGRPGAQEAEEAIAAGWIEVTPLQDPEAARRVQQACLLGDGESEVLALAQEQRAVLVLIDETQGFRRGQELGVPTLRTIGILLQAKAHGLIPTVLRLPGWRTRAGFCNLNGASWKRGQPQCQRWCPSQDVARWS